MVKTVFSTKICDTSKMIYFFSLITPVPSTILSHKLHKDIPPLPSSPPTLWHLSYKHTYSPLTHEYFILCNFTHALTLVKSSIIVTQIQRWLLPGELMTWVCRSSWAVQASSANDADINYAQRAGIIIIITNIINTQRCRANKLTPGGRKRTIVKTLDSHSQTHNLFHTPACFLASVFGNTSLRIKWNYDWKTLRVFLIPFTWN